MVYSSELEELQSLVQFPEEVALMLANTEHRLFLMVPASSYVRHVTIDMTKGSVSRPERSVKDLIVRLKEVS